MYKGAREMAFNPQSCARFPSFLYSRPEPGARLRYYTFILTLVASLNQYPAYHGTLRAFLLIRHPGVSSHCGTSYIFICKRLGIQFIRLLSSTKRS